MRIFITDSLLHKSKLLYKSKKVIFKFEKTDYCAAENTQKRSQK